MTTNVPKNPRTLPQFDPSKMDSLDGVVEYLARLHQFLTLQGHETHERMGEIQDAMPGSKRDRVKVRSRGPMVAFRVSIPKSMRQRKPNAFEIGSQSGPGTVWPKGGALRSANGFVEFISDAPAGVEFVVRLYRDDELPLAERGPPIEPSDDIDEEVEDIENAGDGDDEVDDWTE